MAGFSAANLAKAVVTVTRSEALEAASGASGGDLVRAARLTVPRPRAAGRSSGHEDAARGATPTQTPVTGTTIFAVFFVAAAGIERLLEPIAGLLPDKSDLNKDAQSAKVKAGLAVAGGHSDEEVNSLLGDAAAKAVRAKDWVFGQTVGFWALATIISILASALLKLYLPYVVGIASGGRAFQILATGLIIGGGTKPLHELVGYMTAAKDAKQGAK